MMKSAFEAAVPRGARHRGYAPAWWFARGESIVVVDDFLSPEECKAIVSQMPGPESAMNCPSGKKAQMYVDGDASVETRIRAAVSVGLGFAGEPRRPNRAWCSRISSTARRESAELDTISSTRIAR